MQSKMRRAALILSVLILTGCETLPPECSDASVTDLVKKIVNDEMIKQIDYNVPELEARAVQLRQATFDLDAIVTKRAPTASQPTRTCEADIAISYSTVVFAPSRYADSTYEESRDPAFGEAKLAYFADPANLIATDERRSYQQHLTYTADLIDDGRVLVNVFQE